MSKTVTIPTGGGNPFVVILGGVKYVYKPGETVEVPDGVAFEIEEWERWHEKYYGENVPPFGAGGGGADWNQNDPNAPDYVKNRTHYVEKAFEDITWDGDTEGRDIADTGYMAKYYKVSDEVIALEALIDSRVVTNSGVDIKISFSDIAFISDEIIVTQLLAIVLSPTTFHGVVFPSAGTYFAREGDDFVLSLVAGKQTVHKLDPKYLPNAADTADYQERTHWDTRETKEVTFFEETIEMNFSNTTYPCEQEIHIGDTVRIYIDGELKHTVTASGNNTQTYINPSSDFQIVITNADHEMTIWNGQYSGLCRLDVVTEVGELKQLDEKYIPVKNSITVITIDGNYASMGYNEIMERVNKGEVVIVHMESDLFFYCGDNNEAKHAYFSQLSAHTRKVNYCRIYQDAAWDINSFTLTTT